MKPVATKANLIKTKNKLAISVRGYDLLDKKRNVLIRELMRRLKEVKVLENEIAELFSEAYRAIEYVSITMGTQAAQDQAHALPRESDFDIRLRSVMGVELPEIIFEEEAMTTSYGLIRSNPSLDAAVEAFTKVKYLTYQLAEVENTIIKLSAEISKTQKRANSLDKIQIPKFRHHVKTITNELEEKEREDFFRLKRVKGKRVSN